MSRKALCKAHSPRQFWGGSYCFTECDRVQVAGRAHTLRMIQLDFYCVSYNLYSVNYVYIMRVYVFELPE